VLGSTLGAFASPALAQQPSVQPQTRAVTFGRPCALPATPAPTPVPADSGITPAALFRNGPAQPGTDAPVVGYAPTSFGTPMPAISPPPTDLSNWPSITTGPGGDAPQPAQSGPATTPRPAAPPTITETRDPTGRIPSGTVAPSVAPDGFACPDPGLDEPLYGGNRCSPLDRLRDAVDRSWVSAELLLWWTRSTQVPPLVTTSSPQFNGIVGQGDTRVLLGGGSFGDPFHAGGRIGFGHWFDDCEYYGIDAHIFWVAPTTASFTATDPPYQLLARPFFNVNPTLAAPFAFGQSAEVVAGPGVADGSVTATLKTAVWGADINYRQNLITTSLGRLDLLVGYRYFDLSDNLTITEEFNRIPGSNLSIGVPAQMGVVTDQFKTQNQFNGGQIGLVETIERGRWSLDARTSIAFGSVYQTAEVNGGQALVFPNGGVQTTQGGLLAVPGANIGRYSQDKFAVLPEITLNLGYNITPRLKVFVGYNFMYLSSALRPGGVIDPYIDAARVPNLLPAGSGSPISPARPYPMMNTSGFFIQGINFGLTYKW
jgi:hypothetical protein